MSAPPAEMAVTVTLHARPAERNRALRLLALCGLLVPLAQADAQAANIVSAQTGNWNVGATWVGGVPPVAGDNVTIASSHTVTVTAAAAAATLTLAINASGTNGIVINPGIMLVVSGAITMNIPTSGTSTINVGAGALNAASIAIPGGANASRPCTVTVSTGTINTTGSITFSGTAAQARFTSTGASMTNVGGNFGSGGTLTTSGTGTINFNGNAAQTIGTYTTYNNVTISNTSGGVTLTGTTTIGGTLAVSAGALSVGAFTLTVSGPTTVTGTLSITSTTGTKTFTGNVTINNGGTWSNSANEAVTLAGNLQNNGSFSAGTGVYTFSGSGKTIGGTIAISIPNLTETGTITNNGTLTVATALSGAGGLAQGVSSTLNIGGTSGITTLTATADPNTVNYNGAAQTVKATAYHHLTLSGSGAKTLTNVGTINGDLTLSGTCTATTAIATSIGRNLTVGAGTTITAAGFALTVAGTTSVSGTLAHSSATGVKTYAGLVTVNPGGSWTNAGNSAVTFQGGITHNGATFSSGTGVYTFDTSAQAVGGVSALTISNVTVTGITLTNNSGSFSVATALSGTGGLTQSVGSSLNLGGTSGITTLTATADPNTVNYNGAAQTVKATAYHHLTLSGSGSKTMPGSALTLNGDFLMSGTATATALASVNTAGNFTVGNGNTFTTGSFTHEIQGDFSNSGTFVATGGTITLTGPADQSIGGSATTTFGGLTVNKATGDVTVSTSFNVGGALTFTSGNIVTGANVVAVTSTGAVVHTSGHVVGNLREHVAAGSNVSRTYPIGDAASYAPLDVVFATVTVAGNWTASTTTGDHPNIGDSDIAPGASVNRYWTVSKDLSLVFNNYSATFHFVGGDVDAGANTSAFAARRYSGGTWSSATVGTRTATSTQVTGETGAGDFQIGNVLSVAVSHSVFAFGTELLNSWLSAQSGVIINDGPVTETILGKISTFTAGANTWALSDIANGPDQVRAQWSTASDAGPWIDISFYDVDFTIDSSLAAGDSLTFFFRIQTPASTASHDEYSSVLTVSAQ